MAAQATHPISRVCGIVAKTRGMKEALGGVVAQSFGSKGRAQAAAIDESVFVAAVAPRRPFQTPKDNGSLGTSDVVHFCSAGRDETAVGMQARVIGLDP